MSQDFGCIDGKTSILHAPLNTLTIIYVINNFIHLACKLYVFRKALLWMLNVRGLVINVHDAKVFENSSISKLLRSSNLPAIFQIINNSEVKILNYLIDERAYPLLPYFMRENSTCALHEKVVFNSMCA